MADELLIETDGKVRILTLNRPCEKNSLTNELTVRLAQELRAADEDSAVAVVILTGAGTDFCSGLDPKQVAGETYQYPLFVDEKRSPWKTLFSMHTPVIGAVNGPALNSGLGLAVMCSFIIASQHATFGENYATIQHTHPMGGLISLMAQALGVRRARELSFFGETVGALEAYERHLVNHVVPAGEVMPFARKRAQQLAQSDQKTVALINQLFRDAALGNMRDSYAVEEQGFRTRELDLQNVLKRNRERIWVRDNV